MGNNVNILFTISFTKKLERNPSKTQTVFEMLYNGLNSLVESVLGKWKRNTLYRNINLFYISFKYYKFLPIPGFSHNEAGQLVISPLLRGPNADINTTLGLALITTFTFMTASIRTNGIIGYFKGLMEPTPVMLPMNIIGE